LSEGLCSWRCSEALSPHFWRTRQPGRRSLRVERHEHNAMEGGRDLLANVIVKFASAKE